MKSQTSEFFKNSEVFLYGAQRGGGGRGKDERLRMKDEKSQETVAILLRLPLPSIVHGLLSAFSAVGDGFGQELK